jgi:hypothetical protein
VSGEAGRPAADLVALARLSGVELSRVEADELRPYYDQMQCWLGALRRALGESEEPAAIFVATQGGDGHV